MSWAIDAVKRAINPASGHMKLFGYLLIVAFSLKHALGYYFPGDERVVGWFSNVDKLTILAGFMILLFGSIYRELLTARKEKYANITENFHAICHVIRDATSYLQSEQIEHCDCSGGCSRCAQVEKTVRTKVVFVLDKLADLFSQLTGTSCRSSIKMVFFEGDKGYVYSLERDTTSKISNDKRDRERATKKADPLEGNVDFCALAESDAKERWFFCNNLPRLRSYRTTSFEEYGHPSDDIRWYNAFIDTHWKLPYRSTIVWPIRQGESSDLSFEAYGCLGFLTIDSNSRGVFNERWDCPLGAAVADALFHLLYMFLELHNRSDSQGERS